MPDSSIAITAGAGTNVDTQTNAAGDHRQVIVAGDPSVVNSVAVVRGADPASNDEGLVVRDPNATAIVSGLRDVRIQSIVDGTVSIGAVENITRVKNVVDGTLSLVTRVDRVMNLVDGTISTVSSVTTVPTVTRVDRVHNVVDGTLSLIAMTQRVNNLVDGTLSLVSMVQRVNNLVQGTVTVTGITASIATHILSTNGTMAVNVGTIAGSAAVYFSPSRPVVLADQQSTASIFTVSGSTSGGTTSGV